MQKILINSRSQRFSINSISSSNMSNRYSSISFNRCFYFVGFVFQNVAHLQYQTSYNILTFIILLLLSRSINAATWNQNSPCKQTVKHANSRDAWYKQHGLAWSWLDKLATLVSKNGITFETANFPNIHNHIYMYPNSCKLDNSSSIRKKSKNHEPTLATHIPSPPPTRVYLWPRAYPLKSTTSSPIPCPRRVPTLYPTIPLPCIVRWTR